jgi:hypothetical protein
VKHATWTELLLIRGILLSGIIEFFRLFLCIQVVKIAEPLIEAVNRGQKFVAVAQMVLADLSRSVSLRLY